MIEVIALTKVYQDGNTGRSVAVDRVHFQVRAGEIFGLLGANGAGKTTLLRILATMLRPTSGTVRVCGFGVEDSPAEVRRRIGFVSNNTAIYDRMTAEEMIAFFGKINGLSDDRLRQRTESLMETLRMNDFRKCPGAKLSTGMKQKVSIARALIHDPPVLIFDEATLGLDVMVARNLLQVIRQLRDAGKCLIFSTHIMSEVEKLCDRLAVMHQGQILDCGTLAALRSRHGHHDVEELFFSLVTGHDHTVLTQSTLQGAV